MITLEADPSRVRTATRRDEDELIALCRREHLETGGKGFSVERVRSIMHRAFFGANEPAVIGITGTARIEGSVGIIVEHPWNEDMPFLRVLWHYVLPEYRRETTHGRDMLAFAQRLSEPDPIGFGMPLVMQLPRHYKTEGQARLYRRHFGEPASQTWMCSASNAGGL